MNDLSHFAIHADDVTRACRFYTEVFDWTVSPWGPPGFFQIQAGDGAVRGAIQPRREIVEGKPIHGFECTIAVDDVDRVTAAVAASGGRTVMPKTTIAGVGELAFVEDSEGNVLGVMRYDSAAE